MATRGDYAQLGSMLHTTRAMAERFAADLGRGPGGRETATAVTKLDEARLWLNEAHDVLTAAGVFSALCPCGRVAAVDCSGCGR